MTFPDHPSPQELQPGLTENQDGGAAEERRHSPNKPFRRVVVKTIGHSVLLFALFMAGYTFSELRDSSGPKAGITDVTVDGCEVLGGSGPENFTTEAGGVAKVTERDILALGEVEITLMTQETSEQYLREPGELIDPRVPYNQLYIECIPVDGVTVVPIPGTTAPEPIPGDGELSAFVPAGS